MRGRIEMASVRNHRGRLFFDFRYQGARCREYTALPDTRENRKAAAKILDKIIREIALGTFNYRASFPNSPMALKFAEDRQDALTMSSTQKHETRYETSSGLVSSYAPPPKPVTPLFAIFAEQWYGEAKVGWRATYRQTVADILENHVLPELGQFCLGDVTRAQLLAFRALIAAKRGKKVDSTLSPASINVIMLVTRQILEEAADRFEFTCPYVRIKPLKIPKSDVQPFTLDEVKLILNSVRADYKTYYLTRFFTGMRSGEIDGLKWKYVDFEKRQILVRETVVRSQEEYTKNDASQREIRMNGMVYEALLAHREITRPMSDYVFCNTAGQPLENVNVTKRVWYPLLRYLNVPIRRPYQTRHTAATLWLAAGENPEWIARQMGHANTEMLFTVYSRFVPNLTRNDGSALERLIAPMFDPTGSHTNGVPDASLKTPRALQAANDSTHPAAPIKVIVRRLSAAKTQRKTP